MESFGSIYLGSIGSQIILAEIINCQSSTTRYLSLFHMLAVGGATADY